jgi:hypothetical protein
MTTTESRALVDIPAALLPLIPLPALEGLPDARARGAACVFGGGPLTAETAVDLGEDLSPDSGTTLFLRACRPCVLQAVLEARRTHPGWCEQCVDDPGVCETSRALHTLDLELRR